MKYYWVKVWVGPCAVKDLAEKARDLSFYEVTEGTEHVYLENVHAFDGDDARTIASDLLFGPGGRTRGIEVRELPDHTTSAPETAGSRTEPPLGSHAMTARILAEAGVMSGEEADRWKDEMKERDLFND